MLCRPVVWLVAASWTLAGCGRSEPSDPAATAVDTETLTETLRIPAEVADLSNVGLMTISPDREIVVTQPKDGYLKVFSTNGDPRTVGRSGEGPGEFTNLTRIGWIGDTLWTLDPGLKRTSRFDRSYELIGSTPDPIVVRLEGAAADTSSNGFQAFVQAALPGGALRVLAPFSAAHPPSWAAGLDSGSVPFLRVDGEGIIQRLLAVEPPDPCHVNYAVGSNGRGTTTIPFCRSWLDTGWDGGARLGIVAVTPPEAGGPSYRVTVLEPTGDTVFSRPFPYQPIAVTQQAIDSLRELLDQTYAKMPAAFRQAMPHLEPMSTFPPIRRIVLGRDGTVWLEEFRTEPGHHWLMLSPAGDPIARLTLPANVELMVAQDGTIWGTEEDADGLLGIVRYRTSRGDAPPT